MTIGVGLFAASSEAAAETRSLKLYNTHTHERVEITFKKNGRYVSSGLRDLNRFLRDWRRNESTQMDPKLFDLIWEVYQKTGTSQPIHVVSGYRSPATNNMLRSRSRGVAKNSQHTRGKAMDFFIPGFDLAKLRALGLRKEVGGVGFYPTSGSPFVHMDTGSVRHWPRMTRSQLAKVFPDGVTIHVPSDGKPMPGYQQALARHKKGGPTPTLVASNDEPSTKGQSLTNASRDQGGIIRPSGGNSSGKSFLASLFSGDGEDGEDNGPDTESASAEDTKVRVAAVRPETADNGALPGVKAAQDQAAGRSSSGKDAAVAIAAPPVPIQKENTADGEDAAPAATILAGVLPRSKPANLITVAEAPAAPGTLDAQAQRLRTGKPAIETAADTLGGFIQTASAAQEITPVAAERFEPAFSSRPQVKPEAVLALAAASHAAIPRPAPANGVDAIAAATQGDVGRKKGGQAPLGNAVLAYGAAPTTTASLGGSTAPSLTGRAAQNAAPQSARPAARTGPSLSGQVPIAPIDDPLAQFAALPDRAATPGIMSGRVSAKAMAFASFSHPNQRQLGELLATANRILPVRFEKARKWPLADSFEGEAVVLLPVMTIR
ncbi:DUF882 domain-containing protein [Stappia albiluteola]|uniref:DUF882 domain-containing protein n=1 Tax=Stappia albiluteola TaxID=2758565 RepID=UPI001F453131|nr:DUF882 domain-containing protein [Stappia albiluteola]